MGYRTRTACLRIAALSGLLAISTTAALAQDTTALARNLFSSPGIVDMPSARMGPDGEISGGVSFFRNTQHYNLNFQALPWLETSFRYSGIAHFDPAYPVYYDRSFAFKVRLWQESAFLPAIAVGVNDIVGTGIYGGEYVVATKRLGDFDTTLGMGWGRLGTANGISNPFGLLSNSFKTRPASNGPGSTNFGALFHGRDVGIFGGVTWHAPVNGLLLSAEYSSDAYAEEALAGAFKPKNQWNFGASYNVTDGVAVGLDWLYGSALGASISFQLDPVRDPFTQRLGPPPPLPPQIRSAEQQQQALGVLAGKLPGASQANAGAGLNKLVDALWDSAIKPEDVAVAGRTVTIVAAGDMSPATCTAMARLVGQYGTGLDTLVLTHRAGGGTRCAVPGAQLVAARFDSGFTSFGSVRMMQNVIDASAPPPPSTLQAIASIRKDAAAQFLPLQAISLTDSQAIVYYSNPNYFHEAEATDRLVRILMKDAPPQIEQFRLIATMNGVPQREFTVLRGSTERALLQGNADILPNTTLDGAPVPMQNPVLTAGEKRTYPRFGWEVFPQFRQQLFDPTNPFAVQFVAAGDVTLDLFAGMTLIAEGEVNLYDNFNTARTSTSLLPHVRTDFNTYFTEGKNGLGQLEADYRFRITPQIFAVVRAGYLESMFAGAGGEVLWRPEWDNRWAVGIDVYSLQQRNFDRLLGLQNYRVTTGHISAYYASPWFGLDLAVHAGQYLAGDRGYTFEATRRFRETGVEIGAFFTQTNVSATQFGEGSFDKGIIIRIPLGWGVPIHTQAQFNLDLRPVQRDGGQRMLGDTLLFEETRRASPSETW